MRRWLAVLTAGIYVASCVSPPPTKTSVRQSPSYDAATSPNVDRLGVFVDGAINYDGMSGTFIDIADSRAAIADLSEKTNSALAQKGYVVDFTATPFVGGLLEKPSFQVAQDRKGGAKPMAPPFDVVDPGDPAYYAALRNVSHGVIDAFAHPALLSDTRSWSPAARDGLVQIAAKKHIRYFLVVQGYGLIESGWKQASQGVGTAALTALFTLGTVAVSVHNVSWLDSYVMLIDLESSDILWSNSVRLTNFNPGNREEYDKNDWSRQLLYYLPSRANPEKLSAK
ncbi:MAG TPA: hypothetical protein VGL35_00745 [Rhizomicrobium sp.]